LKALKYNLISKSKGTLDFLRKVEGGLGYFEERDKKPHQRGRKSYISLAKKQASSKIKCGKQLSLIGALRGNTPNECLR
jgi:hypothetical protein